ENWAAPFVLVMTAVLLAWAIARAHGLGYLLRQPSRYRSWADFMPVFVPSLTGMIGYWATLSLNMPDFTRFGHSQRDQAVGQVVATLAVNIAANVVSPANDFANAFPRWISFRRGGLIAGILGLLMQPWRLLADPSGYIFKWLVGYSGGLGSIAGVLIADYWLVRGKRLVLGDLYRTKGAYTYARGWNWRAVAATLAGCGLAWIGLVVPALRPLYDYAWFVGFATAGAL